MREIGEKSENSILNFHSLVELNIEGLNLLRFDCNGILIPKKTEYNIRKYFPVDTLNKIDSDKNIAVEKCLIVLNDLASTYYSETKWKSLNSKILNEQTKDRKNNTYIYKYVIDALVAGTNKGGIIENKKNNDGIESYNIGISSKQYKITDTYLKPKLTRYLLKTDYLIERRRNHFFKVLSLATENTIAKNLINVYGLLSLPSSKELLKIGKKLVKEDYHTKKGKKLTVRNKHTNEYWNDYSARSFVEDNIELYEYLTFNGFIVPSIGGENSGGRVVDSFTLMPSWIRNQIKIDGEETVEIDFKCLHPNIAISLYGGSRSFINHKELADYLNTDLKKVKIEHLSFFNKEVREMKKSILYEYYFKNENWMLNNIMQDKHKNGHKITSSKMFKKETEIMEEVIRQLNEKGIYVLYVYDALLSKKGDTQTVKKIMNEVILTKKVFTFAE